MNSTSNHSTKRKKDDKISNLEIYPHFTLNLSPVVQQSGACFPDTRSTLQHPNHSSSLKLPLNDVGNSSRLPIPTSFVDDLLFRLNHGDSDEDDVKDSNKDLPTKTRSKDCLRQKLQQCKSELQSSRPNEETDVITDDYQQDGSIDSKDNNVCLNKVAAIAPEASKNGPKANHIPVAQLKNEEAITNNSNSGHTDLLAEVTVNYEVPSGNTAESCDAKPATQVARKRKRVTRLKSHVVMDISACFDETTDKNCGDRPVGAADSILPKELTKVVRKTKRVAPWKNDEPVEKNGSKWTLDLSQSDTAIEKALIQRLRKLETITDQYDEQADVIRRKLKKHRRNIWLKHQKSCNKPPSSDLAKGEVPFGRFLPDVQEWVQLDDVIGSESVHACTSDTETRRIQGIMFGKRKGTSKANQPTLTQMLRGTEVEDPVICLNSDVHEADEKINMVECLVDESDCSVESRSHKPISGADDIETSKIDSTNLLCAIHSPPPKVHRVELCKDPVVTSYAGSMLPTECSEINSSSIWDAFRHGMYDSSWDHWFTDASNRDDNAAVNHLLQLLHQSTTSSCSSSLKTQDLIQSPSCLSTHAHALASTLVDKVSCNTLLCPAIERLNPDWKENVYFVFFQKDKCVLLDALNNVRSTQQTLKRMKNEILSNLERQEMLLSVYEDTLQTSLSRFGSTNNLTSPGTILSPTNVASSSP